MEGFIGVSARARPSSTAWTSIAVIATPTTAEATGDGPVGPEGGPLHGATVPFFREEGKHGAGMPGDGPPKGPPIAGAPGGGPNLFNVLGPKKIALIALAGILVGALAALIPRYLV